MTRPFVARLLTAPIAVALAAGVVGCSPSEPRSAESTATTPTGSTTSSPSPTPVAPTTDSTSSTPTPTPTPTTPAHPVSIAALAATDFDGGDLRLGAVLRTDPAYTRYAITYRSSDLTISGIMNIPTGNGPFPVVVLAHGYIDPAVYVTGQGMPREQDLLARRGYAVLHTDYRNHAGSSPDPEAELELRLGYAADVINAVLAIRTSARPELDGDRMAIFGRSMGGGVTYNALVAAPGLVDAAIVYAPVSSLAGENFDRWQRGSGSLSTQIIEAYGAPEANPEFWHAASPRSSFDKITEPVLVQHGTADLTCPPEWTDATVGAMRAAGVDVELVTWPGEGHTFDAAWPESMERTITFLGEHLS